MSEQIRDAYPIVESAIRSGKIDELKKQWRAHTKLKVEIDPRPIRIEAHVLHLLTEQAKIGAEHGEIPLYFLHMQDNQRDLGIIRTAWAGLPEAHGSATFGGPHDYQLITARYTAASLQGSCPLGHTHPLGYGPIFSHVEASAINEDGAPDTSADYHVVQSQANYTKSKLHLMVAIDETGRPNLGVIRIKGKHTIAYHPWEIVKVGHLIPKDHTNIY